MGCSNNPEIKNQVKQNTPKYIQPNTYGLTQNNINPIAQNVIKREQKEEVKPNYGPLGELIDFSKPFKEIKTTPCNFLFLKDKKVIFGDNQGIIHVYYDLNFDTSYDIKLFNKYIQCIIELSDGNIVACSNDNSTKVLKIGNQSYEIIKDIKGSDQAWALDELGETTDFVIGYVDGSVLRCHKMNNTYYFQKKIQIEDSSVLNILGLSENTAMIVYMSYGAYFYDFNINQTLGFIPNQYYNPFKCSVKKISDHELLIGSENSIDLIDYKNFQKIRAFENNTTYAIYNLSDKYILASYGKGYLQTYKMSRDINGQLELKYESRIKVIDGNLTGIILCPDGKLITFNMTNSIKIWNAKNKSN